MLIRAEKGAMLLGRPVESMVPVAYLERTWTPPDWRSESVAPMGRGRWVDHSVALPPHGTPSLGDRPFPYAPLCHIDDHTQQDREPDDQSG